ncbi:MAG: nitronate monooxygenase [Bacteriovoracaceae bacterium]|nr:nitronate monooxygenase [Bacteriovoracaceae bacterium]
MKTALTEMLKIKYPIIMAPMFLVTNDQMMIEASKAGITGCIPALNYRDLKLLRTGLENIKQNSVGPFGVNLIVNQSNPYFKEQLKICLEVGVNYFITSLGNPDVVIKDAHKNGAKVFCDVTDGIYAKKVQDLGADAVIAVNSGAGGHLGKIPATILVPMLKKDLSIPVISAGGVSTGNGLLATFALGADGLSIGSPFIACQESQINNEYKKAVIQYGAGDIVTTTKLSGSNCTVINSPYVKKIGTEQNFLERILNKNRTLKKYAKMLTFYKGMKLLEKSAFSATYKSVWCAGSSIEFVKKEETINQIVVQLIQDYENAYKKLEQFHG